MTAGPRYVLNVIYTPGTFQYLRPLTASLCREPSVKARLVANGCSSDEVRAMRTYARNAPDIVHDVVDLAVDTTIRHSSALEQLLAGTNDGPYFGFADSDMLATGTYTGLLDTHLANGAVMVCAGLGAAADPVIPDGNPLLTGESALSPTGRVFGTTYFAVYNRAALVDTMRRHEVGFVGRVHTELSASVAATLEHHGCRFDLYDTAKVLNLLLGIEGQRLVYLRDGPLVHLGGVSSAMVESFSAVQAAILAAVGVDDTDPNLHAYFAVQAAMVAELRCQAGENVEPVPEDPDPVLAKRISALRRDLARAIAADAG